MNTNIIPHINDFVDAYAERYIEENEEIIREAFEECSIKLNKDIHFLSKDDNEMIMFYLFNDKHYIHFKENIIDYITTYIFDYATKLSKGDFQHSTDLISELGVYSGWDDICMDILGHAPNDGEELAYSILAHEMLKEMESDRCVNFFVEAVAKEFSY